MAQADKASKSQALQTGQASEPPPAVAEFAEELASSSEAIADALAPAKRDNGGAGAGVQPQVRNLDLIMNIPVKVEIILGSATMPVASLAKLGRGAIIPLDRRMGEPVDVVVNGRLVARGEVVVVNEAAGNFGIKLTEVVGPSAAAGAA